MRKVFIVWQDYTENIQQISEDKILHLFQQKYAYQLIVSFKK